MSKQIVNNGKAEILHFGEWQIPYKAVNVLCEDGVRRTARTAMQADTYFSLPARVSVRGKTVSGFLSYNEEDI